RSPKQRHIETADPVQDPGQPLILGDYPHGRDQGSDQDTDQQAGNRDQQRILQTFHDSYIAVLVQKYLDKSLYFLTKIAHYFPFLKEGRRCQTNCRLPFHFLLTETLLTALR